MPDLMDLRPGGGQLTLPIAVGRSFKHTFPESYDMTGPWTAKAVDKVTAADLASPIVSPGVEVDGQTVTVTVTAANATTIGLNLVCLVLLQGDVPLVVHMVRVSDRQGDPSDDEFTVLAANEVEVTVNVFAAGAGIPEGGDEGQVLAKASDDDFDAEWVDVESGGVETVVAGDDIDVDNTDPANPIVAVTPGSFDPAGTASAAVATHSADTTAVHGIADTSALVLTNDSRLSDSRTPTTHATSHQDGGSDELALDGSQITTGTVADARIASTIARDSEVTSAVSTHAGATDPHADRAYTDTKVATHEADTTSVHGIADTSVLATNSSVASAVATHEADTTNVHGIADTSVLATASSVASAVSTHEADTTNVHGITDTSALETTSGAQAKADAKVSDTAYDASSWNGVTTVAPSKNAVRDKLAALVAADLSDFDTQVAATAILKSLVDAKGDLIAATADNTVARVAVGSNGQVLQADSAASAGVSWTTVSTAHDVAAQMAFGG